MDRALTGGHRTTGRHCYPPRVPHPVTEAFSRMSSAVLLPIYIIIFVALIYFVGIRPQQKRRREMEELSRSLSVGDEVVTTSGIYGIVSEVEDGGTIILQVAEDVDIRVAQAAIARKTTADDAPVPVSDEPVKG